MRYVIALAIAFSVVGSASAENRVLTLNEPRDIGPAEYSFRWVGQQIKSHQYLIKAISSRQF
jgi:hypothetical protein